MSICFDIVQFFDITNNPEENGMDSMKFDEAYFGVMSP